MTETNKDDKKHGHTCGCGKCSDTGAGKACGQQGCGCQHHQIEKSEEKRGVALNPQEIAALNKWIGNIDDDEDDGQGDLNEQQIEAIRTMLFKDEEKQG